MAAAYTPTASLRELYTIFSSTTMHDMYPRRKKNGRHSESKVRNGSKVAGYRILSLAKIRKRVEKGSRQPDIFAHYHY